MPPILVRYSHMLQMQSGHIFLVFFLSTKGLLSIFHVNIFFFKRMPHVLILNPQKTFQVSTSTTSHDIR